MCRHSAEVLAVIGHQSPVRGAAQRMRLLQYRVEDWREIAGRGIDDLQYLRGRGLLLQRLARFGEEPGILHRNHRLRREILQQCDLLVGESASLLSVNNKVSEKCVVLTQRYGKQGATTTEFDKGAADWVA